MDALKQRASTAGSQSGARFPDCSPALQADLSALLAAAPGATMRLPFVFPSTGRAGPLLPLFVLGDSHSLTLQGQWMQLLLPRRDCVVWSQLRSMLVVGLKAWHVGLVHTQEEQQRGKQQSLLDSQPAAASASSSASSPLQFPALHPTSILQHHASLIPPGATVLLVAGEIDCRSDEGVAAAVAKGRYPSLDAALSATVDAYLAGARTLARRHRWGQVLLHPVVPPFLKGNKARVAARGWKDLDKVGARAQLIADFNARLAHKVEQMQKQREEEGDEHDGTPPFFFLDFFADLCLGLPTTVRPRVTDNVAAAMAALRVKAAAASSSAAAASDSAAAAASSSSIDSASSSAGAVAAADSVAAPSAPSARFLLHADFTLEGMHLNNKILYLVEREVTRVLEHTGVGVPGPREQTQCEETRG
jgi:hypothetical protein